MKIYIIFKKYSIFTIIAQYFLKLYFYNYGETHHCMNNHICIEFFIVIFIIMFVIGYLQ